MISDAIPTRLRWDGRTGSVSADGVHIKLVERPAGMQWAQVDWAPGCVAVCRDRDCDPERELQADEVRSIAAYVARVAALARAGL